MSWRSTKMPMIRVKENWRNTMIQDDSPALEQNKQEVLSLVSQKIKELKPQLKNELKQILQKEVKNGRDGQDANQWHSNLDSGQEGDFAFVDGDFYQHRSGEWTFLFSAKPKRQALVTGGVSESFVNNAINTALSGFDGGGGAGEVIRTTTSDYVVTNETHVSCLVATQKTVTLPATNTKTVTIKNSVSSSADIIIEANGSTLDGQSDWTIQPGNAFKFVPIGASEYDVI